MSDIDTPAGVPDAYEDPGRWYSTNLIGLPTPLLGSAAFNAHPRCLRIHGTREAHPGLFRLLERCSDQTAAAEVFEHYMELQFDLGDPAPDDTPAERFRQVASYLNLLRGWGYDSNNAQGAVLKGWVESRFGLVPVYHKEMLNRFPSSAWVAYIEEKMCSRFHNNCINLQLDVLYEYCQWSIRHFGRPGPRYVHLWRGTNDCRDQLVEGELRGAGSDCVLRLNNLVSFSISAQRAEEFGDWTIEAEVPTVKLLFFPGLLRNRVLNSECEYLVIGGRYCVTARHGMR
jgi:NAD+---dinitrogen-reductase ADP-D-ribosyltransferase